MAASAFLHMAASNKYIFTFLKLLQLSKCCHNFFLKKLKQYIKETRFYHHTFKFLCVMTCLLLTLHKKLLKSSKENVLIARMVEKKLHTLEFQLKGIGGNMRCKLLQKRSNGKTAQCSKHLRHIAIEKDVFAELNRCIFQISLKYIKLLS